MAENDEFKSLNYYDYDLYPSHDGVKADGKGFYKNAQISNNSAALKNPPVARQENSLTNEKDATTDNGWIAPYDFYAKVEVDFTSDKSVSNGMLQDRSSLDSKYIYRDQYWWCEDLKNWCVYRTDCINYTELNSFYLHVWNGLDDWIPLNEWMVKSPEQFRVLQNNIITNKLNNQEALYNARGKVAKADSTVNNDVPACTFDFCDGPVTINLPYILKKSNTYGVNSELDFQTIRWSSMVHLDEKDSTALNVSVSTEVASVNFVIKPRKSFYKTYSLRRLVHGNVDDFTKQKTQDSRTFYHWQKAGQFLYKVLDTNPLISNDTITSNFEFLYIGEDDDHNEGVLLYEEKELKDFCKNDKNKIIHYDNQIPKKIDDVCDLWDTTYREKYGEKNQAVPYVIKLTDGKYVLLPPFMSEKLFCVYFADGVRQNINEQLYPGEKLLDYEKIYKNNYINEDDDDDPDDDPGEWDVGGLDIGRPIYLSYIDILCLFYGWPNNEYEVYIPSGNSKTNNYSYEKWSRDIWLRQNEALLLSIFATIAPESNVAKQFNSDEDITLSQIERLKVLNNLSFLKCDEDIWFSFMVHSFNDFIENEKPMVDHVAFVSPDKFILPNGSTQTSTLTNESSTYLYTVNPFQLAIDTIDANLAAGKPAWGVNELQPITYNGYTFAFMNMNNAAIMNMITNTIPATNTLLGQDNAVAKIREMYNICAPLTDPVTKSENIIITKNFKLRAQNTINYAWFTYYEFNDDAWWKWNMQGVYGPFNSGVDMASYMVSKSGSNNHGANVADYYKQMSTASLFGNPEGDSQLAYTSVLAFNNIDVYNERDTWCNYQMGCSKPYTLKVADVELVEKIDYSFSDTREGISIANPAVYRLPSGEIALSTQMHWGGKRGLLGKNNIEADRFINNLCKGWFGDGKAKTINDHWLKEFTHEADQTSKDSGLVVHNYLEYGYNFEQINNIKENTLSLTLEAYRPTIESEHSVENPDVAKKW